MLTVLFDVVKQQDVDVQLEGLVDALIKSTLEHRVESGDGIWIWPTLLEPRQDYSNLDLILTSLPHRPWEGVGIRPTDSGDRMIASYLQPATVGLPSPMKMTVGERSGSGGKPFFVFHILCDLPLWSTFVICQVLCDLVSWSIFVTKTRIGRCITQLLALFVTDKHQVRPDNGWQWGWYKRGRVMGVIKVKVLETHVVECGLGMDHPN